MDSDALIRLQNGLPAYLTKGNGSSVARTIDLGVCQVFVGVNEQGSIVGIEILPERKSRGEETRR